MDKVLVLDFGSQYTQLIARRIREQKVYCEILNCRTSLSKIKEFNPSAIVLSGGPDSVLNKKSPKIDPQIFNLGLPILGICYGLQLMAHHLGGKVTHSEKREYGRAEIDVVARDNELLAGVPQGSVIWMSHGDSIDQIPTGFQTLARSHNGIITAFGDKNRRLYGLQFHPEVVHSESGTQVIRNFLLTVAGLKADWTMDSFIEKEVERIRSIVLKDNVILGLSGGVDSSVAAVLIQKAIGKQLTCIFINNGVLRYKEAQDVQTMFRKNFKLKLKYVDASAVFLKALKGVSDPEKKRKIIGRVFVEVFEKESKKIKNVKFLAQGTLYPDVIESVSHKGPSAVIKSHHNVGGLPEKMGFKLLEPFRELFKDEVREIGAKLNMPAEVLGRHPFPGPGLAIRIIDSITADKVELLQKADKIVIEELKKEGWYNSVWQAFAVLLPVKSVGVMGDERTYENVCAVRVVASVDGMTADWVYLPQKLLANISNRIINEVRGINRVVYDISSKPPATIEWE
ncbi:glutamine-hydrolyzing GMP synthase [bacterium]|nr:glutamine-hydrolyzing GMP synthase [bacterium]